MPVENLPVHRKTLMLNADADNVTFQISLDGGVTYENISLYTLVDLTGKTGNELKIKATLGSNSRLRAIAYSWA
ncbi:hypothetical protein D3C79_993450 [compost metagenome]